MGAVGSGSVDQCTILGSATEVRLLDEKCDLSITWPGFHDGGVGQGQLHEKPSFGKGGVWSLTPAPPTLHGPVQGAPGLCE